MYHNTWLSEYQVPLVLHRNNKNDLFLRTHTYTFIPVGKIIRGTMTLLFFPRKSQSFSSLLASRSSRKKSNHSNKQNHPWLHRQIIRIPSIKVHNNGMRWRAQPKHEPLKNLPPNQQQSETRWICLMPPVQVLPMTPALV